MIKLWLVFAGLVGAIHFGITVWRKMEGKERWALTKSVTYSIICAVLAIVSMMIIVILF